MDGRRAADVRSAVDPRRCGEAALWIECHPAAVIIAGPAERPLSQRSHGHVLLQVQTPLPQFLTVPLQLLSKILQLVAASLPQSRG